MSAQNGNGLPFKQILKLTLKRNFVRLALLTLLMAIRGGFQFFKGTGNRFTLTPHTLAKTEWSSVDSVSRVSVSMKGPKGEESIVVRMIGLTSEGVSQPVADRCEIQMKNRLSAQPLWVKSSYVTSLGVTIGHLLLKAQDQPAVDYGNELLALGCAYYCTPDEPYLLPAERAAYKASESAARTSHLGVWAENSSSPGVHECR